MKIIKHMLLTISLASLLLGPMVHAEPPDMEAKWIGVRGSDARSTLDVSIEPTRSIYRVNEPIRFKIKGNNKFFLYVYAVDEETGDATLLIPGRKQRGNKYTAHRVHTVPNRGVEFYSDTSGEETIVFIASRKYIDIDRAHFKDAGDFAMGKAAMLEQEFSAKGIGVRTSDSGSNTGVLVKRLKVRIEGSGREREDSGDSRHPEVLSFLSLNDKVFQVGDKIHGVYGAMENGWIRLVLREPDGSYSSLGSARKIKAGRTYEFTARAEVPYGEHRLFAIYSEKEPAHESAVVAVLGDAREQTKGLSLLDSAQGARGASFDFAIRR
ncbi:MAG: protein of unknown function (DUF4384) [Candidatus Kentron sp. G]|nr:MAG: protein of unknown function (DUF4384) [Candidatus Kentron sp. G]VFM95676.1 MAG: protein of unknown function (DUF4384) [Candidatus Kentron sp. G]VFM98999.1 MAG: protein of unknown function (DUF4384) [Candidatus Kentron sp. G]